jgi:hypothetical protein
VTFSRRLASWLAKAIAIFAAVSAGSPATGTIAADYSQPPGAINPAVTQANISTTICVRGWTATVRPPLSYTAALKRQMLRDRHLPGRTADYELDHYVPLEIGGHPTDPRNLWPEPWPEARLKDKLEYALNRAVCGNRMTLPAAQHCLLDQLWQACPRRIGTPVP